MGQVSGVQSPLSFAITAIPGEKCELAMSHSFALVHL